MSNVVTIRASARDRAGKGAARATRREGRVPGVIYGEKQPPMLISVVMADASRIVRVMETRKVAAESSVAGGRQAHWFSPTRGSARLGRR